MKVIISSQPKMRKIIFSPKYIQETSLTRLCSEEGIQIFLIVLDCKLQ